MLSHKVLTRADIGKVGQYYADAGDDYYTRDLDASAWQGKGAEALGLSGPVERERFQQLLAGHVAAGVNVGQSVRDDAKQRLGIDLTFSAPKSVSMQALVGGDARLIAAHEEAVTATLEHAETLAQARTKHHGKAAIEDTGNMVIGKFRHETSRLQDPQLHTHAVVLNLTKRQDGQWRALRNDKLIKATPTLGAYYRAELATRLTELGYELRHDREGAFELAHISRDQLRAFSQRSEAIEAALAEHGQTRDTATTGAKQAATMATRPKKEHVSRAELHQQWQERAAEFRIDFEQRNAGPAGAGGQNDDSTAETQAAVAAARQEAREKAAEKAVKYAVNHLTERQAIVKGSKLVDTAAKHAMGNVTVPDVQAAVERLSDKGTLVAEAPLYRAAKDYSGKNLKTQEGWARELGSREAAQATGIVDAAIAEGRLVPADKRYTTPAAMAREQRILRAERETRGAVAPIVERNEAVAALADTRLNERQKAAAGGIASTPNGVIGIQGLAGTGKTTMLSEARKLVESKGYHIVAVAPYGAQVKALQQEGFTAKTAMALHRAKDKGLDSKTVLVVDEAGVMPTRLMDSTLKMAREAGARVVLVGDTGQTKAIEAGKPFDQLQQAGMHTVQLDEIIRQKDPTMKAAVEDAAHGRSREALEKIENVAQIPDDETRWRKIADDYLSLPADQRDSTLIVSGTNKARQAINDMIRHGEHRAGTGTEYTTLKRRDTTRAERHFAHNYRIGDVIQPEIDYEQHGLQRGDTYTVADNGPDNQLTVKTAAGESITFSPMDAPKLSVYEPERKEFAQGDKVRITRNDAGLDIANGDRFTVQSVAADGLHLEHNGREVLLPTARPLHLDHAYATTVHSAQGSTSDRVLYDADSHSPTTNREVFYVAISRARHHASIYTDDMKTLPPAVARPTLKTAAMELHPSRPTHGIEAEKPTPAHEHAAHHSAELDHA